MWIEYNHMHNLFEYLMLVVCNYLDILDYQDTYVKTYQDYDNRIVYLDSSKSP